MGEAVKLGGGGRLRVKNGALEKYYAVQDSVDANNFIEFVNTATEDVQMSNLAQSIAGNERFAFTKINEEKAFIAYYTGKTSTPVYGRVVTLNGKSIELGPETMISAATAPTSSSKITKIGVTALECDKVFVTFMGTRNGTTDLQCVLCEINEDVITINTDTMISGYSGLTTPIALDNQRVFLAMSGCCAVFTIDGENIIPGQKITDINFYYHLKVILLSNNKVLIVYSTSSTSEKVYAVVCEVNGTTVTFGTSVQILSKKIYEVTDVVQFEDNRIIISFQYGTSLEYPGFITITVDGTTITVGYSNALSDNIYQYLGSYMGLVVLKRFTINNYIVALGSTGGGAVKCIPIEITEDNAILFDEVKSFTNFPGHLLQVCQLAHDKALVVHATDTTNYTQAGFVYVDGIQAATTKIEGITKTKSTSTKRGEVWQLQEV